MTDPRIASMAEAHVEFWRGLPPEPASATEAKRFAENAMAATLAALTDAGFEVVRLEQIGWLHQGGTMLSSGTWPTAPGTGALWEPLYRKVTDA